MNGNKIKQMKALELANFGTTSNACIHLVYLTTIILYIECQVGLLTVS